MTLVTISCGVLCRTAEFVVGLHANLKLNNAITLGKTTNYLENQHNMISVFQDRTHWPLDNRTKAFLTLFDITIAYHSEPLQANLPLPVNGKSFPLSA